MKGGSLIHLGAFNPKTATRVEIDVELSAHANSRRYFDHRRQASEKENKTVDSSTKALKNAEKKTKQVLREVSTSPVDHMCSRRYQIIMDDA